MIGAILVLLGICAGFPLGIIWAVSVSKHYQS